MNNPNPFVPQGSLLEQHKRRSRMKVAVFCGVALSVCGLTAMLIQGCKREQQPPEENQFAETNPLPMIDTNPPVMLAPSNIPPVAPVVTPVVPEVQTPATTEYVVVQGDTLGKIATAHHVSLKALESANPNVTPTRLRIGQKLQIPAPTEASASATPMTSNSTGMDGTETYTVKSGDTMSKISKVTGVSLSALKAANPNVDPNHIVVGQKLKIPAKPGAPAATTVNTLPAVSSPMPIAPVSSNPPTQQ
jgi:LysM repeat protein